MVGALLADPVATSVSVGVHQVGGRLLGSLHLTVELGGGLELHLLVSRHVHVLGLTLDVSLALDLLASVAALAALEVVVLALGALPATVGEVK